jgi:hypothetical protein
MSSLFRIARVIPLRILSRPTIQNAIPLTARISYPPDKFRLARQQSPIHSSNSRKSILFTILEKILPSFQDIEFDKKQVGNEINKVCSLFYENRSEKKALPESKQKVLGNFLNHPEVQKALKYVEVAYNHEGTPHRVEYVFHQPGLVPLTLQGNENLQVARNLFSTDCPLPDAIRNRFRFQEKFPSQDESFTVQYRREKHKK